MKKIIAITSIVAMSLFVGVNMTSAHYRPSDDVVVTNNNSATVVTETSADANTGGNTANGGNNGAAGDGGSVMCSDDKNTGGNGGSTGAAGDGGTIRTGDAYSWSYSETTVNTNNTTVRGGDDVTVHNNNHAAVFTRVYSFANTGYNTANGGDTGDAGDGGKVMFSDEDNTGGNGGRTGNAGDGGTIVTGDSDAIAQNIVDANRNKTTVVDDCDTCMEPGCGPYGWFWRRGGDDVLVTNQNNAVIYAGADSIADTGYNTANGGDTGDAGDGGKVMFSDEDNTGGKGGSTGAAGDGGTIRTGDAYSFSLVKVDVNHNTTDVRDDCDACDRGSDDVTVHNNNRYTLVEAGADAYSDTGFNEANGGNNGAAGDGGSVMCSDDKNTGGNGGSTGPAGNGGTIVTGLATVYSEAIVVANRTITRIRY